MTTEPPAPATPDGADPSMEEILASIRRILNDDDVPAEGAEAGGVPTAAEDEDVLVLDDSMIVAAPPSAQAVVVAPPEASQPVAEAPDEEVEAPAPAAVSADPWEQLMAATPTLVAPETAAAAASSVDSLVRTLAAERATRVYSGGPTLEDMVRAELRPLVKAWLDTYLPPMVERLVRTEIERVVGREVP
jgi:cell pole-organizing protein PopZ